jgi:cytochrome c oxidase subunit 1
VLFQHLFWFYSHPAVYIMILPAMGVISELVAAFAASAIFGYSFVASRSLRSRARLPRLGPPHVRQRQSAYAGWSSRCCRAVAIPSAVKVFNWTATLYKGSIAFDDAHASTCWASSAVHDRRLTGLFLAALRPRRPRARHLLRRRALPLRHGGRDADGLPGRPPLLVAEDVRAACTPSWPALRAVIVFVGFNLTFFPQFMLGYMGMPRRYHAYLPEFQVLNVLSTAGASVLGFGYLLTAVYLIWSIKFGKVVTDPNPWGATGLEWPHPDAAHPHNFEHTPRVTEEAYSYHSREHSGVH